jgi:hypothetical protein
MLDPAAAITSRARFLDDAAVAVAHRTDADILDEHITLAFAMALGHPPCAVAGLAGFGFAALGRAAAVAIRAIGRAHETHRFFAVLCHLVQRDDQINLDVLASGRTGMAAPEESIAQPAAQAKSPSPEILPAENIAEVDAAEQIFRRKTGHAREAAIVIFGTLLRIGQNCIGFGDFLEALLRTRLLVAVGVIFQRERAECVLDRLVICVAGYAEHFIVITLCIGDGRPLSH